jgi:hypothetical protein
MALSFASAAWADIPAPPVNQDIGMFDSSIGDVTEADCRVCHNSGVPDRHHMLYGDPIPPGSVAPNPGADPDYVCLTCHDENFTVVRDCTVCHTSSPHHTTAAADSGDCQFCHGSLVDNIGDGHYIPTYAPSLVTPTRSQGDGLPLNSRGNGAGACNYCHDEDDLIPPVILNNHDLHHDAGFNNFGTKCGWCHDFGLPFDEQIRVCEGCHGPDSLHNIQADSPNLPTGTIIVGGEDAGYGHVGRDAGPDDSDCWGCHGFAMAAVAPGSGPVIPTVYHSDVAVMAAGTDTLVVLTGAGFTNRAGNTLYESDVLVTAADGSSVTLTPDIILNEGSLAVTIPGDTAPGNYNVQLAKAEFVSNPAVISVVPVPSISGVTSDGPVTISGSGFGGHIEGAGTSITGTLTTKKGKKNATTTTVEATVVSWSDTEIVADFGTSPDDVTVNSVFGSATSEVGKPGKRNGKGRGRNRR